MTVTAPGREIGLEDLPPDLAGEPAPVQAGDPGWQQALKRWAEVAPANAESPLLNRALPEFERALITVALARSGGRRQDAARLLGWGRNTLTRKMRELGFDAAR